MLHLFIRLLVRAFNASVNAMGTSILGLVVGLTAYIVSQQPWRMGWLPRMKRSIGLGGLFVTVSWLFVFGYHVSNTAYQSYSAISTENQILRMRNRTLETERNQYKSLAEQKLAMTQLDQASALLAEVERVLRFPNGIADSNTSKTMMETMLTNKVPRKLFDSLLQFDEARIAATPKIGKSLVTFLHDYYRFATDAQATESNLLQRIGQLVTVRFSAGWELYLRYAIGRCSGSSPQQIQTQGMSLNFDITWDDAERVYRVISQESLGAALQQAFDRYGVLVKQTDALKASLQ